MTNSIKIKHNLFKYFSCMLIAGLIAFSFTSCSKDDEDPVPEEPKTEEEIQAELKEELRTTMKFNSSYKYMLYFSGFSNIQEFDPSLSTLEMDNTTNTPYMAPFVVIDKKGAIWTSVGGVVYYHDKWTVKKVNDQFEISAKYTDMYAYFSSEPAKDPKGGFTILIKYNPKSGETFLILEGYENDVLFQAVAYNWIQNKSITVPVANPIMDVSKIDF